MASDSNTLSDAEPDRPVLRREKTLAIVLGASEWPFYSEFHSAPAFRQSAHHIVDYLRSSDGLNLSPRNVRVIIDSFDDGPEILRQMWEFIRGRRADLAGLGTPASDLLLYYVGHGGFSDNDSFFLSIRSTNENDPLATSITAESLGRLIREAAAGLRNYLVLDCCFAASVSKVFMNGPLGVAEAQLRDLLPQQGDAAARRVGILPAYGTALLCASGPREPAKAPPDLAYTMFTGGLLEVLRTGDANAPPWLSLDDAARLVRARLEAQFANKAVLPVVHAPQQSLGRLDLLPLFPNPARSNAARTLFPEQPDPEMHRDDQARSETLDGTARNRKAVQDALPRIELLHGDPAHVSSRLRLSLFARLPRRPLQVWAGTLALIGALFVWTSTALNASSDAVFALMLSAPLAQMPRLVRSALVRPPVPPSGPTRQ